MQQLVFIENQQVVTDSLTIAEMFGKDHDKVVRDIEVQISKLIEANELEFSSANFGESTYTNRRGKTYRKINLSEDAFTLVAMSYVTPEAMKMKVKFIQEFKRMREFIENQQQKKFTAREQLQLIMQANEETAERVDALEERVSIINDTMRIDGAQEFALNSQGKAKVIEVLGGYDSAAYNAISKKLFAHLWRDFKKYFKLPRYSELPKSKFNDAVYFIEKWRPDTSTALEIESHNNQSNLF